MSLYFLRLFLRIAEFVHPIPPVALAKAISRAALDAQGALCGVPRRRYLFGLFRESDARYKARILTALMSPTAKLPFKPSR